MMNSKELVRAAIRFECPERLPLEFPQLGMTDIHPVAWNQIGAGYGKGRTLDEWGCTWERSDVVNFGQVVGHPLADWKALDHFRWPDPDDPVLYEGMEARFEGGEDKFVQTSIFMLLFERMHALHGFQNTLEDLYLERERLEALADRIIEYDIRIIENIAARFPGKVDGFWFTDDWGTEINTFISTALFVDFFQPRYRKIFDACHRAGWLITMHSCGKVNNFIGLLKEAGADCMNLQQPRALGIEQIGEQYAGQICFSSLCDIQKTLPFKGKEQIEEEAELLMRCWATDKGGFILTDYGDGDAIGVPIEKKRWMLDAFLRNDRWREKPIRVN